MYIGELSHYDINDTKNKSSDIWREMFRRISLPSNKNKQKNRPRQ